MAIEKYSETWIVGFSEQAARLGLDEEGAKTLLKFAAMYESSANSKFQEGFKEASAGLIKNAVPTGVGAELGSLGTKLLGKMVGTPGAAALSTAGAIGTGAAGYYGLWRPHVNKGSFEREAQALRDAVDYGFLDEDQASTAIIQLRKRYADKHLGGTGYTANGPGGGYNWGWNQSSY